MKALSSIGREETDAAPISLSISFESDLPIILDPVMVSTSGSLLLSPSSISSLLELLLPLCTVLTPNLPEAREILRASRELQSSTSNVQTQAEKKASSLLDNDQDSAGEIPSKHTFQTLLECAKQLCDLGPKKVLLKGGHQSLSRREVNEALASCGIIAESSLKEELESRDNCSASTSSTTRSSPSEEFGISLGYERVEVWSNQVEGSRDEPSQDSSVSIVAIRTDSSPHSEVLGGDPSGIEELSAPSEDRQVVMDVLYEAPDRSHSQGRYTLFIKPFIKSDCTHGTGCTLSSAIASFIARSNARAAEEAGLPNPIKEVQSQDGGRSSVSRACQLAISYVEAAIVRGTPSLIGGAGTLDHGCTLTSRGVLSRSFHSQDRDRVLDSHSAPLTSSLISGSLSNWRRYTQHPFTYLVLNLSLSSTSTSTSNPLPLPITHFLIQDYHFLLSYSRLFSYIASISHSFKLVSHFSNLALATAKETEVHLKLCQSVGITRGDIESTRVSEATIAYTRWVESSVREGGLVRALTATLPCLLGYAEVGKRLKRIMESKLAPEGKARQRNIMKEWIEEYGGEAFQAMTKDAISEFEIELLSGTSRNIRSVTILSIFF